MKKKKSGIPNFKSIKEEAEFWDTHSFADYWDELEDVDIVFELDKPRDEVLTVRLRKEIKDRMNKVARTLGLNVSTLVRMWIMEKLQQQIHKTS